MHLLWKGEYGDHGKLISNSSYSTNVVEAVCYLCRYPSGREAIEATHLWLLGVPRSYKAKEGHEDSACCDYMAVMEKKKCNQT